MCVYRSMREREIWELGCVTVAGRVDKSDSVGTSGRKGGGYTVAFASRMGTLELQRWVWAQQLTAWGAQGLRRLDGDTGKSRAGDSHFRAWKSGPHKP